MSVTPEQRAELIEQQAVVLATTGHHDKSRCYVQLREPFKDSSGRWCPPAAFMCEEAATYWVERSDYRCGVTISGEFRPAVVMTRVCSQHMEVLRREPGLIASRELVEAGPILDLIVGFVAGAVDAETED